MRIAFLAYSSLPLIGGSQVFVYNVVRGLLSRSHEVHVFLPYRYWRGFSRLIRHRKLRVVPILRFEGLATRYVPRLISWSLLLRQIIYKYDVWQVIGAYPAGYVCRSLCGKVPLVLRSHGDDIQKEATLGYGLRRDPLIEERIKAALSFMTRMVALTSSVKTCYQELGVSEDRIAEIPNGVDLPEFRRPFRRADVRADMGISEQAYLILSIGRYHLKKGYEYIPEAADVLKQKGYNFKWFIVGKGVLRLIPQVSEMGLEKYVVLREELGVEKESEDSSTVTMPAKALISLYRSADVFVMPSLLETFGMVLIEAMAAGIPVVTTNSPGCKDVVINEINGLQAEAGDAGSLAVCIERLLNDQSLSRKLRENALEMVKKYDWNNVVKRYEDLYYEII